MSHAGSTKAGAWQVNGPHTTMDAIAWDDYRIPATFWKRLERKSFPATPLQEECWLFRGAKDTNPQIAMATRLLGVPKEELLAVVPTCGHSNCANPAHLCATKRKM